jgi:hypothetical protein
MDQNDANDDLRAGKKRGRQSIISKLVIKAKTGQIKLAEETIPNDVLSTLEEMDVDLEKVNPAEIPKLVKEYHKRKNCEASARYRRRKVQQMEETKAEVAKLEKELNYWKSRCAQLEEEVAKLRGSSASNQVRESDTRKRTHYRQMPD